MPCKRFEWLDRVKAVEREYSATRFAADQLLDRVRQDSTSLVGELRVHDVQNASDHLEGTYIIRLFAEFETSLRVFRSASRTKDPPSRTRDLLESVAARTSVPNDWLKDAHDVREYRNSLVHEREEETAPIPIAEARRRLCRFLSFLPLHW